MTIEFDEKGKFFTDIVPKFAVHSVIQTTTQLVRGNIHVRQGERLKDELDENDLFLAVTDAAILGAEGQVLFQVPFLAVRRSHIVWVFPDGGETQAAPKTS